jgi:hypothetical protein
METIDFKEYTTEDFRTAVSTIKKELANVNLMRQQLLKEERTISTLMYMLFPKEAMRDGYMSATSVLTARLSAAKKKKDRATCSVKGCVDKEVCKGMCSLHYSRENRARKQAALRDSVKHAEGYPLQVTA